MVKTVKLKIILPMDLDLILRTRNANKLYKRLKNVNIINKKEIN